VQRRAGPIQPEYHQNSGGSSEILACFWLKHRSFFRRHPLVGEKAIVKSRQEVFIDLESGGPAASFGRRGFSWRVMGLSNNPGRSAAAGSTKRIGRQ
jgi:hypothetical protein